MYYRDFPDSAAGAQGQIAFYGLADYGANPAMFDSNLKINTPLTSDRRGAVYFGFVVTGNLPGALKSGIARIDPDGSSTWTPVTAVDASMTQVVTNCALAVGADSSSIYAAVSDGLKGYLIALDSGTLELRASHRLQDPATGQDAMLSNNGSASPTMDEGLRKLS